MRKGSRQERTRLSVINQEKSQSDSANSGGLPPAKTRSPDPHSPLRPSKNTAAKFLVEKNLREYRRQLEQAQIERIYDSKERQANQNGALTSNRLSAANQSPNPVLASHGGKHTGRRSKPRQKLRNDSSDKKLKHSQAQDQRYSARDDLTFPNADPYQLSMGDRSSVKGPTTYNYQEKAHKQLSQKTKSKNRKNSIKEDRDALMTIDNQEGIYVVEQGNAEQQPDDSLDLLGGLVLYSSREDSKTILDTRPYG